MKAMRDVRPARWAVGTLQVLSVMGLVAAVASGGWAATPLNGESGATTGWKLSQYPSGIPYLIGSDPQGDGTADLPGDREFKIVQEAFQAWANVSTSAIRYQFLATAPVKAGPVDSANTVAFDPSSAWARAGALAVSLTTFRGNEIVEADILLFDSPKIRWTDSGPHKPATTAAGVSDFNLKEIVTREIGHFNGLHVSFLRTPYDTPLLLAENGIVYRDGRGGPFTSTGLLYPYPLAGSPATKSGALLSSDEMKAVSALYPAGGFAPGAGEISGTVFLENFATSESAPVCGANVMAIDPATNNPIASAITGPNGRYTIKGLSPGAYRVYAEPSSPDDLGGLFPNACDCPVDYYPEFHGDVFYSERDTAPTALVQAGGSTNGIDITVTKVVASREIRYALGGQTDTQGNRLIVKVEPDDEPIEATPLRDGNDDGIYQTVDTIQQAGDIDSYSFPATRDDTFLIEVASNRAQFIPQFELIGPGIPATAPFPRIALVAGDVNRAATVTFTATQTNSYVVRVSNLLGAGGGDFIYTLTVSKLSGRVPIQPLSPPTAVLSIPIGDAEVKEALADIGIVLPDNLFGNIEIQSLSVQFLDVDGDAGLNTDGSDFLPPTTGVDGEIGSPKSGFSLFRDDGSVPGVFDFDATNPNPSTQDRIVRLVRAPEIRPIGNGFEVTFIPEDPLRIPAQRIRDAIADFHVVVQTSANIHHGDDFQVIIPTNGIALKVFTATGPLPTITLFGEPFPEAVARNIFAGDIIRLTTFLADFGATVDARSVDFPIIGIDVVGDPAQQYWLSEVEVTFVGYNFVNADQLSSLFFQAPPTNDTFEMTDLLPLNDGDNESGGVNIYKDNNGDGIPQTGLSGDLLLPLQGTRRFEVIDPNTIPDEFLLELIHPSYQAFLDEEDFLAGKDHLNLFAFKAILPLRPTSALAVPPNNQGANLGPDFFITIRTSNTVRALDAFIPFIQVGGIKVRNNLQAVLANNGNVEFSSLAIEGSNLRIDPTTFPRTTLVEVRPSAEIAFKDLVNPSDPSNRGAIIGSASEGSPPLGVFGLDAMDFYADASRSLNVFSGNLGTSPRDLINTGSVLEALTVIIDPADRPLTLPPNFILPVSGLSLVDDDLLNPPVDGIALFVDDNTPFGDFLDNDNDGLADEELVNQTDDDLDGVTDEDDLGDEDSRGANGRLDTTDDLVSYLQFNDFLRFGGAQVDANVNSLAIPPVTTLTPEGSIRVDFPSLEAVVNCEFAPDFALISDPLSPSIFSNFVFVRVDHPLLVLPPIPTPCDGPGWTSGFETQIGFDAIVQDATVGGWLLSDDFPGIEYNYDYMTQIPNSNGIPEFLGPDFFVTVRMGPGARSGDNFRARIPAGGFTFSSYRDPIRSRIRRTSVPPVDFTSTKIRVGTDNIPPTLTFLSPTGAANQARAIRRDGRQEFEFLVTFRFDDPDNEALADFFFDTNNFGVDGEPIPLVGIEQTSNVPDNDGQEILSFTFRFPPELANSNNPEAFIYAILNDNVNPPRAVYSGFPIIISATDRANLNLQDFLIADNRGRLFGTGGANVNIPDFDQRTNAIRDFELTPTGRGGLYLTGVGDVVLRGDPRPWQEFIRTTNRVMFPENNAVSLPMDLARDVEPDFRRNGYYLLTGDGTVYPVGAVPPPAFQLPLVARFPGLDVARDMELTPTGLGLLILAEDGRLVSLGDAPNLTGITLGFDAARDLALTPSFGGAYILDAYGMIHFIGDADPTINLSNIPVFFGSDVYRAIEATADGEGLLVMNREGQVFAAGDVSIGPNVVEPGVVPLPPGSAPGQEIQFPPNTNVVLGEADGAFVDLEVLGIGGLAQKVEDILTSNANGICRFLVREDLKGLLSLFDPAFLDDQGHNLDELAATWKSIFDYFICTSCRIPSASLEVSQFPDENGLITVDGVIQLLLLNPKLTTFAPADDYSQLEVELNDPDILFEERGQTFFLGPILFDQAVRFWEIGDGRGWHLNILDDDYREGLVDRADHVLAQRDFFRTRRQRRIEGDGTVFLASEGRNSQSVNSVYIFEFIEFVEAALGDPTGGWGQPILNVLWYDPNAEGELPFSNVRIPFSYDIRFNPTTGEGKIVGGERATVAILPDRTDTETIIGGDEIGQEGSESEIELETDRPGGFRFFPPIGTHADPRFQFLWDSQLYLEIELGGQENALGGLVIPNIFSSASIVNLSELAAFAPDEVIPGQPLPQTGFEGVIPLPDSLELSPEDILELIPLDEYQRDADILNFTLLDELGNDTGLTSIVNDYLITFSADDQGGSRDRVTYATLRVTGLNSETLTTNQEPILNNPIPTVVFTWRYKPQTDFLPWRAFKDAQESAKTPGLRKTPKKKGAIKPNFGGLDIKPNLPEAPKPSGKRYMRALPGMLK